MSYVIFKLEPIFHHRFETGENTLLLKDAKTKYYTELILHCEGDSKKLFRVVNSLCKERSVNLLPSHTSPLQLADDFEDFFCSKISRIREYIASSSVPTINISVHSPVVKLTTDLLMYQKIQFVKSFCHRQMQVVN